jgi:APA family basic amino acid/polyamine antiporter
MVVGTMIGAGIFVLPASLASAGWGAAWGWLVGGAGVLAIGQVIAALTIRYPQEPGLLTICGDILGLLAGRIMAWSYWVGLIGSAAVLANVAGEYALFLLPVAAPEGAAAAIGLALLVALTAVNLRGVRDAGRLQVATTALKLLPLVVVIAIIAMLAVTAPATYTQSAALPVSAERINSAIGVTFFALLGFEAASMITQRVRDPERNIMRATIWGLALVLAIYVLTSMGIVLATPPDVLAKEGAPLAAFTSAHVGPWAASALALFAAISAIGALNAVLLLFGEVPFGMVRDGQLPHWMAPQDAHGIGRRPILLGAGLTAALVLISPLSVGEQVLDFLLRLTTATTIFFYTGICIAAIKVGIRPVLAAIGAAFTALVLYGTGTEASLLGLGLMAVGVAVHFALPGRTAPRGTAPAA